MNSIQHLQSKVFIVDDDRMTTAMYEQAIEGLGYNDIQIFHEGRDAVNRLIDEPQIIFLDQNMDHMSGLEVLRKVKRFNPNIYVVFVSGQDDIQTAVTSLKFGAFDYIVKGAGDIERIEQVLQRISNVQDMIKQSKKGPFKKFLSLLV